MNLNKKINELEINYNNDPEDVKSEIRKLIEVYYISFLNNDLESLNKSIENIDNFINDFKNKYPSIDFYITSELLKYNNELLREVLDNDLKLYVPDVSLSEIQEIRNLFDDNLMREILESEKDL